jgi:hypothetical protein
MPSTSASVMMMRNSADLPRGVPSVPSRRLHQVGELGVGGGLSCRRMALRFFRREARLWSRSRACLAVPSADRLDDEQF